MAKKKLQPKAHSGDLTPPSDTAGDRLHALVRAGIPTIPVVGSPAVELFNMVIAPPVQKRQREWMESVAQRALAGAIRCSP